VDENNAEALHYLSVLHYQQRRWVAALDLARRAVTVVPNGVDAHVNLGNICVRLGLIDGATHAYERAVELWPDHPQAAPRLNALRAKLAVLEEAAERYRRAHEEDPANAEFLYELAAVYQKIGRVDEELATLTRALALRPEAEAFYRVGSILSGMGRVNELIANYEAWLRAEPDNPVAKHLLSACTGKDVPARASPAFVAGEFDRFAESFEEALSRLEYRAPALIAAMLERVVRERGGSLDIMDAGCGTGLLGPYLRPHARRLVGVDLSARMLEKAAGRGLYDELVAGELTLQLRSSPHGFDIVAASDTLNYFGDLLEVFDAARNALRPGGCLVFTLEHDTGREAQPPPAGYRLHRDGRYMHAESYVREALAQAGFEVIDLRKDVLRCEGEAYVEGLVVAARTP
jgi:predicted TPR repeat methyltransferase